MKKNRLILLIITYFLFRYTVAWINYYNQTDERMPNSIWRYTCDYPVIGIREISDLDDKPLVRQRRKRNTIVTIMVGIIKGKVMCTISDQPLVTSTLPASYTSVGNDSSPARSNKTTNGVQCHTSRITIEVKAKVEFPNQSRGKPPKNANK